MTGPPRAGGISSLLRTWKHFPNETSLARIFPSVFLLPWRFLELSLALGRSLHTPLQILQQSQSLAEYCLRRWYEWVGFPPARVCTRCSRTRCFAKQDAFLQRNKESGATRSTWVEVAVPKPRAYQWENDSDVTMFFSLLLSTLSKWVNGIQMSVNSLHKG